MGIHCEDDVVLIRIGGKEGEPTIITVNCMDKTDLGCDLCCIILHISKDGKWCYFVFWVVPRPFGRSIRWGNLKKRLSAVCPSCFSAASLYLPQEIQAKLSELYMLKLCALDRKGLLHDVTEALCELELTIRKVKVSTTPDEKVMDLFFVTDTREQLHMETRRSEVCEQLRNVLGESMVNCGLELVDQEMGIGRISSSANFSSIFSEEAFKRMQNADHSVSVAFDNMLSPSHSVMQILSLDHKGLLYDTMRTLKDYNIQLCYGRFTSKENGYCEVELFIVQSDGKKIIDPEKQKALCSRLRAELLHPLQVKVVRRDGDMELLVANLVELSGRGRPLVFYDITLALKKLNVAIFLCMATEVKVSLRDKPQKMAEIGRYAIGDREWEVYRILLLDDDDDCGLVGARNKIEEEVRKLLMGWD